jgi:4-hydroxybenzoate polyprenyltransferase
MSSAQSAVRPGERELSVRLAAWLTLARISNSPTVASNVLAGAALAGVLEPRFEIGLLVVAMVAFYTAGMFLNDVCDYRWDVTHRPDRPLVVGAVSRSAAVTASVGLFGLGIGLLWLVSQAAFLSGAMLIGLIVAYDVWHKSNPLSPLVMAACRLMVYVGAFAAFAWPPTATLVIAGGVLVAYLVGLTAVAKSEVQAGVVARLIAGISLVDALVLSASGAAPPVIGAAVVLFVSTLLLQRHVEGT